MKVAVIGELVDSHGPEVIPTVAIAVLALGTPLLLVGKRLPNRIAT